MLRFPNSTEYNKIIPKSVFYSKGNLTTFERKLFVSYIDKIIWSNKFSEKTLNVSSGKNVEEIEVLKIVLKIMDIDFNALRIIKKMIPYKILFVLEFNGKIKLAVYQSRLFQTPWKEKSECSIELVGLDMDIVWENILIQVGNIEIAEGNTLAEQIQQDEERMKILKQIEQLEAQARRETNPRKKFELVQRIKLINDKGLLL